MTTDIDPLLLRWVTEVVNEYHDRKTRPCPCCGVLTESTTPITCDACQAVFYRNASSH